MASPPRRLGRRALLRGATGAAVLFAAGCVGGEEEPGPDDPTPAPDAPDPTATQAPISSPIASYLDPDRYAGRTLTVASLGGPYQDAQAAAYFEPFALATGAEVQQKTATVGDLKDQVDDGNVVWDVVCLPTEAVLPLARADYLTPIDYAVVDKTALLDEVPTMQYGVVADFFSTAIAYPTADPEAVPRGWADVWDLSRFGEGRSLRRNPVGTLEFALLADGVPPDRLYPLDLPRAFRSLDRIRPAVSQWWEDGKQPVDLVAAGQVGLASAWNVRVADLPDAADAVRLQWAGGMLSADSWMVPRGAPNDDVAMDFINYATRAGPNADFCRLQPFGPVNRDAFALLRADRLPVLPTADPQRRLQFVENWNYWADNLEGHTERFEAWLLAEPAPTPATPGTDSGGGGG